MEEVGKEAMPLPDQSGLPPVIANHAQLPFLRTTTNHYSSQPVRT